MSSQMKGLIGTIIAVLSLWSNVTVEVIGISSSLLTVIIIPIITSILAIYLGILARKEGAKIWGLIAVVLGIIAVVTHGYGLLAIAVL